jgi:hypothetical protein
VLRRVDPEQSHALEVDYALSDESVEGDWLDRHGHLRLDDRELRDAMAALFVARHVEQELTLAVACGISDCPDPVLDAVPTRLIRSRWKLSGEGSRATALAKPCRRSARTVVVPMLAPTSTNTARRAGRARIPRKRRGPARDFACPIAARARRVLPTPVSSVETKKTSSPDCTARYGVSALALLKNAVLRLRSTSACESSSAAGSTRPAPSSRRRRARRALILQRMALRLMAPREEVSGQGRTSRACG